jgi:K+-sensing histidine kinase KdpD
MDPERRAWTGVGHTFPEQKAEAPSVAPSGDREPAASEPGVAARYLVACAVVAAAFVLRHTLYGDLDYRLPFIFFVPAAMVAAWYGGLGPGLFVLVAGLLLGDYFFLPPHHALGPLRQPERLAVGLYTLSTALGVALIEHLRARIRRLDGELRALRERDGGPSVQETPPGLPR